MSTLQEQRTIPKEATCVRCDKKVRLNSDDQCINCGRSIQKHDRTLESMILQFEQYVDQYREVLDAWIPIKVSEKRQRKVYAVIKIGIFDYFISLSILQQFDNLSKTEKIYTGKDTGIKLIDEPMYEKYLALKKYIENYCPRMPSF